MTLSEIKKDVNIFLRVYDLVVIGKPNRRDNMYEWAMIKNNMCFIVRTWEQDSYVGCTLRHELFLRIDKTHV
jgi:hypothetical protein